MITIIGKVCEPLIASLGLAISSIILPPSEKEPRPLAGLQLS
jgi:hypothetical protein